MRLNSWRVAVGGILKARKIKAVRLAEALGFSEARVHYYLHGRRPDPETVRRINREVSRLVDVPEVRDYLLALALRDGLLKAQDSDIQWEALALLLGDLDPYFVHGSSSAIQAALDKAALKQGRVLALFIDLAAARGRHIFSRLKGTAPHRLSIDEAVTVFRQYGVSLEPYLRADNESRIQRAREFFALWVEAVITSRFSEAEPERCLGAIHAILEQFAETADEIAVAARGAKPAPRARRVKKTSVPSKFQRRGTL